MAGSRSILIVEDEILVAMDIEATFLDANWQIIGPVPTVDRALAAIREESPDAVCLDMNLNGVLSAPVACALRQRGIPFVLVTGYSQDSVPDAAYEGAHIVRKPFTAAELVLAMEKVMAQSTDRSASAILPAKVP